MTKRDSQNRKYTYTCHKCKLPILDVEAAFIKMDHTGIFHRLCLPADTTNIEEMRSNTLEE
jgi:predicted RNA-binding protein with PUA domain